MSTMEIPDFLFDAMYTRRREELVDLYINRGMFVVDALAQAKEQTEYEMASAFTRRSTNLDREYRADKEDERCGDWAR